MYNQETTIDYITYDSRNKSAHNRSCIDGTITGSGNCIAYCEFGGHPGFLTEKLRSKHSCLEKECIYYLPKTRKSKRNNSNIDIEHERILAISKSATSDMAGMKVMSANREVDGVWTIYYISIAEYFLDAVSQMVEERMGVKVAFVNLEYRFEFAAELIFGVKSA